MNSDNFESMVDDWLDGCLTDADERRFADWLKDHPRDMQRFVDANIRNELLREAVETEITVQKTWDELPVDLALRNRETNSERRRVRFAGSIALVVLVLMVAFVLTRDHTKSGVPVEIVAVDNLVIDGFETTPNVGENLRLDRVQLISGSMEIELESGVRVELIAPVETELINAMRMRLIDGRISANVGTRGKGFTVETNAGRIVDLGTRFGVEANASGESRVAVFSGSVEFHPLDANADSVVTLTEGEALEFSARAGLRRWQQVAMEADRAGLGRGLRSEVIEEVYDNLGEDELRPFYGVIANGLTPGALAFTDKPNPVWMNVPGKPFPSELIGADLVRTYHQFRNKKSYRLTLSLAAPADVFVFLVAPGDPPRWLTNRFQLTGERLRSGTWHKGLASHPAAVLEPEGNFLDFTVWKCEAGPGEIELGPPRDEKVPGVQALMYGVAVKARNK